MITYNHKKFIEEAINGVLMQECDFEIELILTNDCSTDKTDEVIQNILKTHPRASIINYIKHEKNIGMMPNFIFALQQCKGKYIALLDGDDYWTDPLKLQKQVDFLEANPDYGICFHNVEQQNTLGELKSTIIPNVENDKDFTLNDYILENRTATCSMLFKRNLFNPIPSWFGKLPYADLGITLSVLKNSNKKGRVFYNTMGVYRVHSGGIHAKHLKNSKTLIETSIQHLDFITKIEKYLLFDREYKDLIFMKKKLTLQQLINFYQNTNQFKYFKYKIQLFVLRINAKI